MQRIFKSFVGLVYVFAVLAAVTSVGCKQDPLEDFGKSVQKGVPPKNTKTNPAESDSVVISANDYYEVEEGQTLSFDIGVRVFRPGSTASVEIKNPGAFPGMKFDPATGTFTWTAPTDFSKDRNQTTVLLNVMGVTNEAPYLFSETTVRVSVLRKLDRPEIVSVVGLTDMSEEEELNFTVQVKSIDGEPTLAVTPPSKNTKNAAAFIGVDTVEQDPNDPTIWIFNMSADLRDLELTRDQSLFYFNLQAFSPSGLASVMKNQSFFVYTTLSTPEVTWPAYPTPEFTSGQSNTLKFEVYDPKFEDGDFLVDTTALCSMSVNATCMCQKMGKVMQCTIEWTPEDSETGRHDIQAEVKYIKNLVGVKDAVTTMRRSIRVVKGSTP